MTEKNYFSFCYNGRKYRLVNAVMMSSNAIMDK